MHLLDATCCTTCAANTWLNSFILKCWPCRKQLDLFGVVVFLKLPCAGPRVGFYWFLCVFSNSGYSVVHLQQVLPLTSDSIKWLSRAPMHSIFSGTGALPVFGIFSAGARFALVSWLHCVVNHCHPALWDEGPSQFSCQLLCCIIQMWAHCFLLQGLNCILASVCELKISDPDVWGVFIIWLCKSSLVYGLK